MASFIEKKIPLFTDTSAGLSHREVPFYSRENFFNNPDKLLNLDIYKHTRLLTTQLWHLHILDTRKRKRKKKRNGKMIGYNCQHWTEDPGIRRGSHVTTLVADKTTAKRDDTVEVKNYLKKVRHE